MKKRMDDDLRLEQLLARCKELDPQTMIRLYFDPDIFLFYIDYLDIIPFWLPSTAFFIGECKAQSVQLCIELYIGHAVKKALKAINE